MSAEIMDAAGRRVRLPRFPSRIISLVPSITETLFALGCGERVVGVTRFCTEPADRVGHLARVGGQKNPNIEKIRSLRPDLVIANKEENRREDVEALEGMGIPVMTTYPRTVQEGIAMVRDVGRLTGTSEHADPIATSLEKAYQDVVSAVAGNRRWRVFCPIWRRPYMSINHDTYVHDVLATCGALNIFADKVDRYPKISLAEVADRGAEIILFPDEPYPFHPRHVADFEPFRGSIPALDTGRLHFVDGKMLSWYGPRIGASLRMLQALFCS